MRYFLIGAAAALALTTVPSQAEDIYIGQSHHGGWIVHSGTAGEDGTPILRSDAGMAPSPCPAGSFWLTPDGLLRACAGNADSGIAPVADEQDQKVADEGTSPEELVLDKDELLPNDLTQNLDADDRNDYN